MSGFNLKDFVEALYSLVVVADFSIHNALGGNR